MTRHDLEQNEEIIHR